MTSEQIFNEGNFLNVVDLSVLSPAELEGLALQAWGFGDHLGALVATWALEDQR